MPTTEPFFQLFDPKEDLRRSEGANLPHWFQPGVTYFVTFRTEDSIPLEVARLWRLRRDDWLRRHGIRADACNWNTQLATLPRDAQREFHETFSREFLEHLDQGYGACLLKQPEVAQIVADALRYFDGERYCMSEFVVMPNHVHLLVGLLGETDMEDQCYSWKHFTATKINRLLGRSGRFWQEESFDHLIRSADQFEAVQRYIADNPVKAGLSAGQYLYWRRT